MSDPMVLGGKLLSLLEEANVTVTYKPALLMSIIDCATEMGEADAIPVSRLADRVLSSTGQGLKVDRRTGDRTAGIKPVRFDQTLSQTKSHRRRICEPQHQSPD